jgi:hypothetical protein
VGVAILAVTPSHQHTSLGGEDFNLAVSSTLSEEGSEALGAEIEEHLITPRSRQQRAKSEASGPAGNKRAHIAADASTFFELQNNHRSCKFCL